ncbi:MOSC domain-containing protein [Aurantiacibacter flavus]|uniref:MOSC domain-containing protein n=1 Tax=Aurantiacibacter flavus TaxID=3145232 RepID=A0ABV0CUD6_9SPHN
MATHGLSGRVAALAASSEHCFSKQTRATIVIRAGLGVEGDAHSGTRVQHLSRIKADPAKPNLRQVHLIHAELLNELSEAGYSLRSGDLGENILTEGIDLLELPRGALLHIGDQVELEVTGLRNPCGQIEAFQSGLLSQLVMKACNGRIVRKAGIMTVARVGGIINCGDAISVALPEGEHQPLEVV